MREVQICPEQQVTGSQPEPRAHVKGPKRDYKTPIGPEPRQIEYPANSQVQELGVRDKIL